MTTKLWFNKTLNHNLVEVKASGPILSLIWVLPTTPQQIQSTEQSRNVPSFN
ncbi:MAG: hypothetical protein ACQJCO_02515 [cyanobacterium endosymbiont of Rhopalodia sterrenbergii]